MKKVNFLRKPIEIIKNKHLEFFGWVGYGKTFRTKTINGYHLTDKFPPLNIIKQKEKETDLKKVLMFYSFLRKNAERLYNKDIIIETPYHLKFLLKDKPTTLYINPDQISGKIIFAYGEAIDEAPLRQIEIIIHYASQELIETKKIIKNMETEIKTKKEDLIIY